MKRSSKTVLISTSQPQIYYDSSKKFKELRQPLKTKNIGKGLKKVAESPKARKSVVGILKKPTNEEKDFVDQTKVINKKFILRYKNVPTKQRKKESSLEMYEEESSEVQKLDNWERNTKNAELQEYSKNLKANIMSMSNRYTQEVSKNRSPTVNYKNLDSITKDLYAKPDTSGMKIRKNRLLLDLKESLKRSNLSSSSSSSSGSEIDPNDIKRKSYQLGTFKLKSKGNLRATSQENIASRPQTDKAKDRFNIDHLVKIFAKDKNDKLKIAQEQKVLEEGLWKEYTHLEKAIKDSSQKREKLLFSNNEFFETISKNKERLYKVSTKFNKLFKGKNSVFNQAVKKSNKNGDFKDVLEFNHQREKMKKEIKSLEHEDDRYIKMRSTTSE
ncbi:unnamed protein product [Moneuplotes crassus]|uniref:Uncharacterized protein n=1 Tax=Euplotes crassus TaxID=5936 RepID=A0AAD2D6B0_EUPCR|nr:unnamed protein product [Moneuplotes crassus]